MRNWAGNVEFAAAGVHRPASVAELRGLVAGHPRVRALGTGHSFNRIADTTGELISLAGLPPVIELDGAARRVEVAAGVRYGELAAHLHRQGFAVHNLGSLPHISVAGAVATGTHGSGDGNRGLAAAVAGLELLTADGELRTLGRDGDTAAEFAGTVVGLGALGIVTRLWLDVEPAFSVRQDVFDDLAHETVLTDLDEILASGYSVSLFTRWQPEPVYQLWRKRRVAADDASPVEPVFFGATAATAPRHPLPAMDAVNCTEQLGRPGPWHERLPHFRLGFTPSGGAELQSEYLVPRAVARRAVEAVAGLADRIAPVLQISELRSIAADEFWLSPSYRRDSLGLHFTWLPDVAAVAPVLVELERRLEPLGARPHWGKLFDAGPAALARVYERYADFRQLRDRRDPGRKFTNDFLDRYFPPC